MGNYNLSGSIGVYFVAAVRMGIKIGNAVIVDRIIYRTPIGTMLGPLLCIALGGDCFGAEGDKSEREGKEDLHDGCRFGAVNGRNRLYIGSVVLKNTSLESFV